LSFLQCGIKKIWTIVIMIFAQSHTM